MKVSLISQIAAVNMALERTDRIVGVSDKARLLREQLAAAARTLAWVAANEREIKDAIKAKGGRS